MRHAFPLLLVLFTACGSPGGPDAISGEPFAETFDRVWSTVDQQYSYFDAKGIDWPAARDQFRPRAVQAASEAEFRSVIGELLGVLRDAHVNLRGPTGTVVATFNPGHFVNWKSNVWSHALTRHGIIPGLGAVVSGSVGTVRYVAIRTWAQGLITIAEVDAALGSLAGATAVIIDVRMNGGGSDAIAYPVAGRFTPTPVTGAWYKYRSGPAHGDFGPLTPHLLTPWGTTYQGPVLLLTGRACMSACEGFVSALRALPTVTVMGDTTFGATGSPGTFPLRDGWSFTVSRWIQYTADMLMIEGSGIAPAVVVPCTAQDLASGQDPVLEEAFRIAALAP
jgi:C-terminal processing protease CtpA/Prc